MINKISIVIFNNIQMIKNKKKNSVSDKDKHKFKIDLQNLEQMKTLQPSRSIDGLRCLKS